MGLFSKKKDNELQWSADHAFLELDNGNWLITVRGNRDGEWKPCSPEHLYYEKPKYIRFYEVEQPAKFKRTKTFTNSTRYSTSIIRTYEFTDLQRIVEKPYFEELEEPYSPPNSPYSANWFHHMINRIDVRLEFTDQSLEGTLVFPTDPPIKEMKQYSVFITNEKHNLYENQFLYLAPYRRSCLFDASANYVDLFEDDMNHY